METIVKEPSPCDICGKMIDYLPGLSPKYDELYLAILQIGQRRVNHGISYDYLLSELRKRGFDVNNGCIDLAIKHWFCDAYYHVVEKGKFCGATEVENHSSCSFILKAQSSLLLLEHEKVMSTIKLARWAILTAIIVGVITVAVSWYLAYHPVTGSDEKKDALQTVILPPAAQITTPVGK